MSGLAAFQNWAVGSILQATQDIMFIKDTEGRFVDCSPAFATLVGRPAAEIIGRSNADLFSPKQAADGENSDRVVLEGGRPQQLTRWWTFADGRRALLRMQKSRLTDPEGRPVGLLVIWHDITSLHDAEERMRISAGNFETFFETIDDMIVVASQEGRLLYINGAVTRKLGYTLADLATAHVLDLNPPDKRDEAIAILNDMFAGRRDSCPLPIMRKDGSLIPAETRVWFGRWNGETSLFSLVKDLSKEQELLQKFNKVFDLNPALMAMSTLNDRVFRDVNHAFLQTLGYSREEVVGRRADELNLFVNPDLQRSIADEMMQTGRVRDRELQVRKKSGEILDGLFSGELIETQGERFLLTVMTDITPVKRIEHALREQTEFQHILTDIANRYICEPLVSADATISQSLQEIACFVNADRAYVFDYAQSAALCTSLWTRAGTEARSAAGAAIPLAVLGDWIERHRAGEIIQIPDVAALPPEDIQRERFQVRLVQSVISLPIMLDNTCLGFVGFEFIREAKALDASKLSLLSLFAKILASFRSRKDKEEQLLLAKEQAESGSRAKGRFLANMSHEIRTPMNGMLGYLQLMADLETNPEISGYIAKIRDSAQTLLTVINDILDMSKIEAGKLNLESVRFDLPDLVESVANFYFLKTLEKGVDLQVQVAPDLPRNQVGDPTRIRQVLGNLLNNAVKFTHRGSITVRVSRRWACSPMDEILFEIEDTGIGLSRQAAETIFEPFTQADSSATRRYGGTGLGLAICRDLVTMMGGTIGVESEAGCGSRFHFTIPCRAADAGQADDSHDQMAPAEPGAVGESGLAGAADQAAAAPFAAAESPSAAAVLHSPRASLDGISVLLVEDNEINREVATAILHRASVKVMTAANGAEAVLMLTEPAADRPDLVLMDIHMPVMDGYEATRKIHAALGNRCPPIVAMTAGVMAEEREMAAQCGMVDYVVKPIEISQLLETIRRCLGR